MSGRPSELTPYPLLRGGDPPQFLYEKYGEGPGAIDKLLADVDRFLVQEVQERRQDQYEGRTKDADASEVEERLGSSEITPTDPRVFEERFGSIAAVFSATAAELEQVLTGTPPEKQRKRMLLQRLLVWEDPTEAALAADRVFDRVISQLPRRLAEVELLNDRDIIDPLIVAFASKLLHEGDISSLLRDLVAHKCMMKLEDMAGTLHQEVLGRAGGCDRVPEPQGVPMVDAKGRPVLDKHGKQRVDKDVLHPQLNPYPGSDIRRGETEFYQLKNKTGSAKGSDGEKLGRQFLQVKEQYPNSQRYYVSVIGKTLKGHRSMGGFTKTDPEAEVLVGLTAMQQIGRHRDIPDILLDLYLERFAAALVRNHYSIEEVVEEMSEEWKKNRSGENPLHALMRVTVIPDHPYDQSSATYNPYRRGYQESRGLLFEFE
jgi:hypothetical protein